MNKPVVAATTVAAPSDGGDVSGGSAGMPGDGASVTGDGVGVEPGATIDVANLNQRLANLQAKRVDDKARIKELEKYKAQYTQVGVLLLLDFSLSLPLLLPSLSSPLSLSVFLHVLL